MPRFVFKTGAQGLGYYRDDKALTKTAAPIPTAAPTTKAGAEISAPMATQQSAVVAPTSMAAAGPFDYQKLEVPLTRAVMTNTALFELD